jgi:hypothetical protein
MLGPSPTKKWDARWASSGTYSPMAPNVSVGLFLLVEVVSWLLEYPRPKLNDAGGISCAAGRALPAVNAGCGWNVL